MIAGSASRSARCACLALAVAACSNGANGHDSQGGGTIIVTASGEALAVRGYDFPYADVGFVDGWEVRFDELLVTVDKVTLSENPDANPGDQSKTGARVAEVDGPWAIDLHKGGPLAGKGGQGEEAVEIARVASQNQNGDAPFANDTRYAFGFDVIAASPSATFVNLDAQGKADYAEMIQKGYAVLYVGTATFRGEGCAPEDPVFDAMPKVVKFRFGFASPTTYANCQNPDNDPAMPFAGEEHERGVIVKGNQPVTAQLTIHTDHPFWESFKHDSPAHFDPIAAQYVGVTAPTAVLEDMKAVDPTDFKTQNGALLPWRSCSSAYTPPSSGQLHFDTQGIPVDPTGDPTEVIQNYAGYMTYTQSTQGHLNSDGLCFVDRHYPSPR